jgi:ribosomal protein S18 acetylase RimI-like enzyme
MIRPYRPADRDGLANVCIRTGAGGEDATNDYADPTILPQIFATPYAHLEPALAFVLEDSAAGREGAARTSSGVVDGIAGYILGTSDTAVFARRFRDEWLPLVGDRYPPVDARASDKTMADQLHNPERMVMPELADWPAHLHINLLPAYQGQGFGRQMMETFTRALRRAGVSAVHLGMSSSNTRARAFYDRMAFEVLDVPGPSNLTHLGLRLT